MKSPQDRRLGKNGRGWAARLMEDRWGSAKVVSRGKVHYPSQLPGFIALLGRRRVGLATYRIYGDTCELVTIDSLLEGEGVGSALLDAVKGAAKMAGCKRLWLVTTNDNLRALGFYQKRGFHLAAIHLNALAESRKLKPEIPFLGLGGIPLRDEVELELQFDGCRQNSTQKLSLV